MWGREKNIQSSLYRKKSNPSVGTQRPDCTATLGLPFVSLFESFHFSLTSKKHIRIINISVLDQILLYASFII